MNFNWFACPGRISMRSAARPRIESATIASTLTGAAPYVEEALRWYEQAFEKSEGPATRLQWGSGYLSALVELFNASWVEPFMVQAFIPAVVEGDKRIVLVDGEVAGAINRVPGKGEIRSNLAAGGSAVKTELTEREHEICAALGPELKKRGLLFVGIDVIGGEWLTEINVTSPTGIVAIDNFNGSNIPAMIWDAISVRLAARQAMTA